GRDGQLRITHAQRKPERRYLIARLADGAVLLQGEVVIAIGLESCLAIIIGRFSIRTGAGGFGKRAPVTTRGGRRNGLLEHGLMGLEKIYGHYDGSLDTPPHFGASKALFKFKLKTRMTIGRIHLTATAQVSWSKSIRKVSVT